MNAQAPKSRKRTVLLGCVISFVLIAGILIVVGRLISGRVLQARSMGRLRTLGTAVEMYHEDHRQYPPASSIEQLQQQLSPKYLPAVYEDESPPSNYRDEWENSMRYECWKANPSSVGCDTYAVASSGRDGKFEHASLREYR